MDLLPRYQRHLWLRYEVEGYTEEIDLAERLKMVYTRDDGQEVFVSHTWRRLFEIRAPLVKEFIFEFFSTCMIDSEIGLDVSDTLCFQLGGARRRSERVIPDKGDLSDYWVKISSGKDFLRGASSYTYIRDLVQRLYGGHFIRRLAHHFGLVSNDGLRGLSVVTHEIPLIDMAIEDAHFIDEGAPAVLALVYAPQPPPPQAAGKLIKRLMGPFEGAPQQSLRDVLDRGPGTLALHSLNKTNSKFNTIVHEYVTEQNTLSKLRAKLRKESVYKSVEAKGKV
nr:hypothetical protein [Tanacetum cinerariifolium]